MKITGKVHCFFEQTGTFKNEFIKLGIPAEDYDIQNNFGQTDHVVDLFAEIEDAYAGGGKIFSAMNKGDLILAFFPCIYFCENNQLALTYKHANYKNLTIRQTTEKILERAHNRELFYGRAVKMFSIAKERGLRLIMENSWNGETFLKRFFIEQPSLIDKNRMLRGDYFTKPTAYWFVNCEPTYGHSIQQDKQKRRIASLSPGKEAGICSEERSMISPDYARNFICDFVIGKEQKEYKEKTLFDYE